MAKLVGSLSMSLDGYVAHGDDTVEPAVRLVRRR